MPTLIYCVLKRKFAALNFFEFLSKISLLARYIKRSNLSSVLRERWTIPASAKKSKGDPFPSGFRANVGGTSGPPQAQVHQNAKQARSVVFG